MFVSHFRKTSGLRDPPCIGALKCLIAATGHSKYDGRRDFFRAVFFVTPGDNYPHPKLLRVYRAWRRLTA